ncbi:hypothetical protein SUGI_0321950 [Cryptomeria japonica]|uniref:probable leucine-rich repeat receptor-like protein kinase At2g33170 n=1 Tax=Cryptomeria japonica TaxID=3369 RepID=UPI002408B495|nr:probable leucine-rich repeat receptor-like protein kinase At2g33170 [Cryptomeria japonica]GLJ18205.1 hypothetical protein SUGI_0321950 [Cryptomeria japonica]
MMKKMGILELVCCNSGLFIFLCLYCLPGSKGHPMAETPSAAGARESTLSPTKELILYALAIGTFILLGICFLYRAIRSRRCVRKPPEPTAYQIQFEAHELSVAARGYHKDYLIGFTDWASVFKAVLPDGLVVAIKRLNLNNSEEANQRFLEVCIALTQVRHCNLVGVLGFSVSSQYKYIVTEYVDCPNLEQLLHDNCNLSWETRLKIAHGTARALVYMHEECRVNSDSPLVHGNIKPSNIFVDIEEQEPILSDYGITSLIENFSGSSCAFQGLCGYAAPECLRSEAVTEKSDVYSYGIVLLQLLTLKQPSSEDVSGNLSEWIRNKIIHSYEGVLDPAIFSDATESRKKKIKKVLGLALMCTRDNPQRRPSMKEVVESLIQMKSFDAQRNSVAAPVFGIDNV